MSYRFSNATWHRARFIQRGVCDANGFSSHKKAHKPQNAERKKFVLCVLLCDHLKNQTTEPFLAALAS
jgi:hypothetical protein